MRAEIDWRNSDGRLLPGMLRTRAAGHFEALDRAWRLDRCDRSLDWSATVCCADDGRARVQHESHSGSPAPRVSPTTQPRMPMASRWESSQIAPLIARVIAIDLATTLRTALADNLDIRAAQTAGQQSRGQLESRVGGAFPRHSARRRLRTHVDGTVRAVQGNLVGAGFNTFSPSIAVQWIVSPGSVVYEIIAAKKRLSATSTRSSGCCRRR